MDIDQLRAKSTHELTEMLEERRDAVRKMEFQVYEKQLKNVRALRLAKKEIAQILMVLHEQHTRLAA